MQELKDVPLPSHKYCDDPADKNKGFPFGLSSTSTRKVVFNTILWIGFGLFGWYFPRFLIYRETSIVNKIPPYQVAGGETVIVDFALNQPLVRPATVESKLILSTRFPGN
jgi:hypothetical protein